MTLGAKDIANDLGVLNITVWRWIKEGQIKATMANRRAGWKIEEEEYARFLEEHPKWRLVHNGDVYKSGEIEARQEALLNVTAQIISSKATVGKENRNEQYIKGFERAITDIQAAINREMVRKTPCSRSEQST
jgi:hypothetical protein